MHTCRTKVLISFPQKNLTDPNVVNINVMQLSELVRHLQDKHRMRNSVRLHFWNEIYSNVLLVVVHCDEIVVWLELFHLRSRIGLATREFGTRRTLVSSRRKQTCTPLKQPWMLPMCRHRPARQTLQQHPTQVKCTAALPSSLADSETTLRTPLATITLLSTCFSRYFHSISVLFFIPSQVYSCLSLIRSFSLSLRMLVCWYLHQVLAGWDVDVVDLGCSAKLTWLYLGNSCFVNIFRVKLS